MYESKLAQSLVPYVAGEQPRNMKKLIKLNTNENPYPPSPKAIEAIGTVTDSLRLYPDMEATALREAIAQVNGVKPENVFCANGSDEALAFAFAAFFAGKKTVSCDITYSFYPVYAKLFGAQLETVPLLADWSPDVDGLMQKCPIALANPNAPTGILLPRDQVERLAAHAREAGEVLLVDEAYAAFSDQTALPLLEKYDNLLIVRTFSKSHALAGMRVGYCIGSEGLINSLRKVRDSFNSYPLDRVAQAAATASMLDTEYTAMRVRQVEEAREYTRNMLMNAGIPVLKSATNFLFVQADPTDAKWVLDALRARGILVRYFSAEKLKPWLRVSIGTMEEMQEVAPAMVEIIKGKKA